MFYFAFFLTVFALFSAFFFICAVYSAAKFDSLFFRSKDGPYNSDTPVPLNRDEIISSAKIENVSSEGGETLIILRLLPPK